MSDDPAWQAGAEATRNAIVRWHEQQSQWFGEERPNSHMTDEDRMKFRWAAASHAAHAAHIGRMPLPKPT